MEKHAYYTQQLKNDRGINFIMMLRQITDYYGGRPVIMVTTGGGGRGWLLQPVTEFYLMCKNFGVLRTISGRWHRMLQLSEEQVLDYMSIKC